MFVLLCTSRVGGTTLLNLMKAHPKVGRVIGEPFNRNYHKCWKSGLMPKISRPVRQVEQMRAALEYLHIEWGGKPHGYKMMRYSFTPQVFMEWVKEEQPRIVFVERKNILKTVISNKLAHHVQAWNKRQYPEDYRSSKWPPFPLNSIQGDIHWRRQLDQEYKDALADYGFLHVYYEDFYFKGDWKAILLQIQDYFGYPPLINPKMEHWMATQRINDEQTYLNIENVYEIERKLGNNYNGRLFENGPPLLL